MVTAVARRPAPPSPAELDPTSATPEPDPLDHLASGHLGLEQATRRWLAEGDTPDNVAAYATALRELLRSHSG